MLLIYSILPILILLLTLILNNKFRLDFLYFGIILMAVMIDFLLLIQYHRIFNILIKFSFKFITKIQTKIIILIPKIIFNIRVILRNYKLLIFYKLKLLIDMY